MSRKLKNRIDHNPRPEKLPRTAPLFARIKNYLENRRHDKTWEYGELNSREARRNKKTGEVQMLLRKAGYVQTCSATGKKYTYIADWWHNFDSSWWPFFKRNPLTPCRASLS